MCSRPFCKRRIPEVQQLIATYRGGDSFVVLTDKDTQKLHDLASRSSDGSDALALQYLLQNYKDVAEPSVKRADTWMPVVGLVAALLVFLLILAILIALFMSRFCCCCYKNKKEVYQVNTIPTYKTIEPLYVAAPTHPNERFPGHLNDTIYSTPYSGSPLPYPPPPGTSRPITPSTLSRQHRMPPSGFTHQHNISDPVTPKTQRRKDRGEVAEKKSSQPVSPTGVKSHSEPASARAQRRINRGELGPKHEVGTDPMPRRIDARALETDQRPLAAMAEPKMGTLPGRPASSVAGDSATYALPPESIYSASTLPHPAHRDAYLPPIHEAYGTIPRPWISPPHRNPDAATMRSSLMSDGDLSFLDPNRKLEVQTKEDFIY
ncbi:unnamed protein product, partial [Mesorhabditis spiculigera]